MENKTKMDNNIMDIQSIQSSIKTNKTKFQIYLAKQNSEAVTFIFLSSRISFVSKTDQFRFFEKYRKTMKFIDWNSLREN